VSDGAIGSDTDYALLVGLDEAHTLELATHTRTGDDDRSGETRWLAERDPDARLVARYRTWSTRSRRAPYRSESGWERWSLDGRLLDREVRYSTRAERLALN